jgi:class 3 adenylate cyclase
MLLFQASIFARRFWSYYNQAHQLALRQQESNDLLRLTNQAIGRFIPQAFLAQLPSSDIVNINLGDYVEQNKTILFSDIRNFTRISEQLTIHHTFHYLNSYLEKVGPQIRNCGGYIEKYIGDAIMAVFDQPTTGALSAAIAMQRTAQSFSSQHSNHEWPPLQIGVAVHADKILAGIIGEEGRMSSAILAEAITVVEQIEAMTKIYQAKILISQSVLNSIPSGASWQFRPIDRLTTRNGYLAVFEVLDQEIDPLAPRKIELRSALQLALEYYWAGAISKARYAFRELESQCPEDLVYQHYLTECNDLDPGYQFEKIQTGNQGTDP